MIPSTPWYGRRAALYSSGVLGAVLEPKFKDGRCKMLSAKHCVNADTEYRLTGRGRKDQPADEDLDVRLYTLHSRSEVQSNLALTTILD